MEVVIGGNTHVATQASREKHTGKPQEMVWRSLGCLYFKDETPVPIVESTMADMVMFLRLMSQGSKGFSAYN